MQSLVRGVHHFRENVFDTHRALFAHLEEGQTPEALFITCSDSRIDEHLVTQTRPGDMFVLRNAGNIIPPYGAASNGGEGATIEYAIQALKISHIVVCGHTHCGAMNALLHPETLGDFPLVSAWLKHAEATRLIVRDKYNELESDADRVFQAAKENVLMQIENLQTHPVVAAGLAGGRLKLHGWLYVFETGMVLSFDPAQDKFVPLANAASSTPAEG